MHKHGSLTTGGPEVPLGVLVKRAEKGGVDLFAVNECSIVADCRVDDVPESCSQGRLAATFTSQGQRVLLSREHHNNKRDHLPMLPSTSTTILPSRGATEEEEVLLQRVRGDRADDSIDKDMDVGTSRAEDEEDAEDAEEETPQLPETAAPQVVPQGASRVTPQADTINVPAEVLMTQNSRDTDGQVATISGDGL